MLDCLYCIKNNKYEKVETQWNERTVFSKGHSQIWKHPDFIKVPNILLKCAIIISQEQMLIPS